MKRPTPITAIAVSTAKPIANPIRSRLASDGLSRRLDREYACAPMADEATEQDGTVAAPDVLPEPGFERAWSIPSGAATVPSCSVASSAIGAQAYSRSNRRLSPSLANRLRIGFAIGFAVLTAMAVIGVGRFIQQRQDFEDSIARSYQVEMVARERIARGTGGERARAVVAQRQRRSELRDEISGDTRDTALLVAAGLIAGLTGAAAPLQRPDLLDAPAARGAGRGGRPARGRRPQRPGRGRRPRRDRDARRRLQRDGRGARAGGGPARQNSTGSKTSSSSPPRTSCAAR